VNVNEYAFALGALAHHTSDHFGHPLGVNRVVPILYPKLRAQYGRRVLYADSPARHLMVEFAYDVLEVARGAFKSDAYQARIGFEVSTPVLERAFRATYGLDVKDVFGATDLAIGTYRYAVSRVIPDMTRLAWRDKRDEILATTPGATERAFVYSMTRRQYEDTFGTTYRKPSLLARFVVLLFKIVPKFGPFRPLAFKPLTPDTERLFVESFAASHKHYDSALQALRAGRLEMDDVDLDTGAPSVRGANPLADETYGALLAKLARGNFQNVPPALRRDINEHYASHTPPPAANGRVSRHEREAARRLVALNASADQGR
jgi:hypothetical protein